MIVFINGMPGSGKSTVALRLVSELGYEQVVQTDFLKNVYRYLGLSEEAFIPSHQAWRLVGEKTSENAVKGFEQSVNVFEPWINGLVSLCNQCLQGVVVEGVHATPRVYEQVKTRKKGFFLNTTPDRREEWIKDKLDKRKKPSNPQFKNHRALLEYFDIIQALNTHLLSQARRTGFTIINNNDSDKTVQKILSELS